ncbi:MAG: asparaginase [Clostridiales bacterium]|nr:asparaginase [Clostridiales bacterium]
MVSHVPLVKEYRSELLDLTHYGYIAVVDERGKVLYAAGDPDAVVYYRSASKPLQALPVIRRGLDKKYALTDEETVLLAGSHAGEPYHIAALESIAKKTGLSEDMLVMKPAVPGYAPANEERIRQGLAPRKFYHNCAGKHLALMLVQRELGARVEDYWRMDAPAELEVRDTLMEMSEAGKVELGVDGCGVPVFAVGVRNIAIAFKNLACMDTIRNEGLRKAAAAFVPRIHQYPHMMRGTGYICTYLNCDPNIVAKGGALGVYGFGLKKERLGVAFKVADGTEHNWPLIAMSILRDLGCLSRETEEHLMHPNPILLRNDNETVVGRREVCFKVAI